MSELNPCPFCDKATDLDDCDTLYPNGVYWYPDGDYGKHYSQSPTNHIGLAGNPCYKLVCDVVSGGCGAEMHGDSKQEVIDKWNRRV